MLILTRKIGESILIGDNIRVTILEIRGKQIRVGIDAPADIVVLREEIYQRLAQDNLQAAHFAYQDLMDLVKCSSPEFAVKNDCLGPASKNGSIFLDTRDLGRISVPNERLVTLVSGMPGFETLRTFAVIKDPKLFPFCYLQSLDDPALALPVADPHTLMADYQISAPPSALKELGAETAGDLRALVLLTIPSGRPQDATANLLSPILINPSKRQGKQVVLETSQFSSKFRVVGR